MMIDQKLSIQSIERLNISDKALDVLKENDINNIGTLCERSKSDLKKLDLIQNEINKIDIELQLLGLNLRNSL